MMMIVGTDDCGDGGFADLDGDWEYDRLIVAIDLTKRIQFCREVVVILYIIRPQAFLLHTTDESSWYWNRE
jgi:hypothetical protein